MNWRYLEFLPSDISSIEDTQPDSILMVGKVGVCLQSQDLRITNVCAVYERAQEKECKDG